MVNRKKTPRLSRLLGENRYTVVILLVALWIWNLDSALDGVLVDPGSGWPRSPGQQRLTTTRSRAQTGAPAIIGS
jgi:hypothetical protein